MKNVEDVYVAGLHVITLSLRGSTAEVAQAFGELQFQDFLLMRPGVLFIRRALQQPEEKERKMISAFFEYLLILIITC